MYQDNEYLQRKHDLHFAIDNVVYKDTECHMMPWCIIGHLTLFAELQKRFFMKFDENSYTYMYAPNGGEKDVVTYAWCSFRVLLKMT